MSNAIYLSLGAGVQSTTMLLMAMAGEFETVPDRAIFADTGWEPRAVYDHLAWLESVSTTPIERVSVGNIREDTLAGRLPRAGALCEKAFVTMPLYVDSGSKSAPLRRQCTKEYKLTPLRRRVRELLAERGEKQADMWIGISTDEAHRMRDSVVRYIVNCYPLVDAGLTRADCLKWCAAHGYAMPPRSACIGCPFHSDSEWRRLQDTPEEWRQAVEFDKSIRTLPRIRGDVYLHRALKPLDEIDFRTPEDGGQLSLFGQDCEGMCGL